MLTAQGFAALSQNPVVWQARPSLALLEGSARLNNALSDSAHSVCRAFIPWGFPQTARGLTTLCQDLVVWPAGTFLAFPEGIARLSNALSASAHSAEILGSLLQTARGLIPLCQDLAVWPAGTCLALLERSARLNNALPASAQSVCRELLGTSRRQPEA